jgi:hypothetical protein
MIYFIRIGAYYEVGVLHYSLHECINENLMRWILIWLNLISRRNGRTFSTVELVHYYVGMNRFYPNVTLLGPCTYKLRWTYTNFVDTDNETFNNSLQSRLGGLVVIVLVIEPKVRSIKPGEGDGFIMVIKIRITTSFGGEVKPSVPCRKMLRSVKISHVWTKICHNVKLIIPFADSSCFLPYDSDGRVARECLWPNQQFSPVNVIRAWFSMIICVIWGMNYRLVGRCSSET